MIPYSFRLELDRVYDFTVRYNVTYDFFTIDLAIEDEIIILGEKITYGRPLFQHIVHRDIPIPVIIPFQIKDKVERITYENLGDEVFLFVGDEDE